MKILVKLNSNLFKILQNKALEATASTEMLETNSPTKKEEIENTNYLHLMVKIGILSIRTLNQDLYSLSRGLEMRGVKILK